MQACKLQAYLQTVVKQSENGGSSSTLCVGTLSVEARVQEGDHTPSTTTEKMMHTEEAGMQEGR